MNNAFCKGSIVMIVNTVAAVINLKVYARMLEEKQLGTKKILNFKRNCKAGFQRFIWRKEKKEKSYFVTHIKELRYLLDKAYQQMQRGEFRYAIYDADNVMREAVKMILQHNDGYTSEDLLLNIKTCERRGLFGNDKEFVTKLYKTYHICRNGSREIIEEKHLNYIKVYFTIMMLKDLLNFAERELTYS